MSFSFLFSKQRKTPDEVFTPRAASVNDPMYVHIPDLENSLTSALAGNLHIVIHGESGTGKSWLYKKVLAGAKAKVITANLANASRFGSLNNEFLNVVNRINEPLKTGYTEKKSAEVNAVVAKGTLEHVGQFSIGSKEPLEACLQHARTQAGEGLACLVFENLEQIIQNEKIMNELSDTLVLLDDDRYATYRVKILIVGVPKDVKNYFAKTKNLSTVGNRIREIPEVSRLTYSEASELITRGFINELQINVSQVNFESVKEHLLWVTDRIPQRIHEYCLELAKLAENNEWSLTSGMTSLADKIWLKTSLSAVYSVIENAMNAKETKIGRRNQCIYCLGLVDSDTFRASDIETLVRSQFSDTTKDKTLNVGGILTDLANSQDEGYEPIIKKTLRGDSFEMKDPKYRMCIRTMLYKTAEGTVAKKDIGSI